MRRTLVFAVAGLTLAGVAVAACALAWTQVEPAIDVRRVSATQVGQAMAADRFYSDYRRDVLVITAVITKDVPVEHQVDLATSSTATVTCQLDATVASPPTGAHITVITLADNAIRRPGGVLLEGCVPV